MAPVVLHVIEAVEAGVVRHVADVVTHADADHHVAAPRRRAGWVTDHALLRAIAEAGAVVHPIDMRRRPTSPHNAAALATLTRDIRRLRPDVVHGHSSVGGALGRLATIGTAAATVYTPNGVSSQRAVVAVERRLGRRTDVLVAVSASEGELVRRLRLVPDGRVAIVPNGIDLTPPPPHTTNLRAVLRIPEGAPVVGCVARLVPQKAPVDAVLAFARVATNLPDAHLVIVGSGPLRPQVDAAAVAAGLAARVHVVPVLEGAAAAFPQFDVILLPSRFEGCPYVVLEAFRAGVPVVASDVVGTRDVIADGESGLLVQLGDIDGYAAAVERLIGEPPLRAALTDAGRQRLASSHDVTTMGRRLSDLYVRLAAGDGRRPARRDRRL